MFGAAASALAENAAPSPFQRDLHAFGLLTARLTLGLVLVVLTTHMLFGRPVLESLMFAVALAVGLTPELLPMITTVTLSRGALRMAARKVIVKRLGLDPRSRRDDGAVHRQDRHADLGRDHAGPQSRSRRRRRPRAPRGSAPSRPSWVATAARWTRRLVAGTAGAAQGWTCVGRHAFDFNRRLGSVLAAGAEGPLLIVKGAPEAVLALCTSPS